MIEIWTRLKGAVDHRDGARYATAAAFVLLTVLVRWWLDPVFSARAYYQLYFPAVILAAYLLGAGPAILATAMASLIGYFIFSQPMFQVKAELRPHLSLVSFL